MSEPFTLEHFQRWASELILDNGDEWELEEFQAAFAEDVFLGKRECWLVVPEGNGKSTLLAGLALYHAEFTTDAWVPIAASSRDQAKIIYRQAKGFVRRTPRLDKTFRCYDGYRRIHYLEGDGQIEVFAADDRTGDGIIPTLCIVDELHRHRSLDLYLTWHGKLDKRGAQILVISTAGEPGSEFEETRERFRQTAGETTRSDTFVRASSEEWVLHDWAVPEAGDPDDLTVVKAANPFSGVTVETLKRKRESPSMTDMHWRRFVCNLPTRSGQAAIQEKEWHEAATTEEIPEGEPVWVGLDVGWKWDTTAAVPLWLRDAEFRLLGPATVLVPPRDGTSLDPNLVKRALIDIHERNRIDTLVMDESDARDIRDWADEEIGCTVIPRQQTNSFLVADYELFMEALRNGWLHHSGDPGLTRHALNAVAKVLPYGDARFARPVDSRRDSHQHGLRVIDALAAAAMAHAVAAEELAADGEVLVAMA